MCTICLRRSVLNEQKFQRLLIINIIYIKVNEECAPDCSNIHCSLFYIVNDESSLK